MDWFQFNFMVLCCTIFLKHVCITRATEFYVLKLERRNIETSRIIPIKNVAGLKVSLSCIEQCKKETTSDKQQCNMVVWDWNELLGCTCQLAHARTIVPSKCEQDISNSKTDIFVVPGRELPGT